MSIIPDRKVDINPAFLEYKDTYIRLVDGKNKEEKNK